MEPITIRMPKDKLASLIDLIRETTDVSHELYDASLRWEIEVWGVEEMEPS